jgi:hypothetical protein
MVRRDRDVRYLVVPRILPYAEFLVVGRSQLFVVTKVAPVASTFSQGLDWTGLDVLPSSSELKKPSAGHEDITKECQFCPFNSTTDEKLRLGSCRCPMGDAQDGLH